MKNEILMNKIVLKQTSSPMTAINLLFPPKRPWPADVVAGGTVPLVIIQR